MIQEVPFERWDVHGYYDEDTQPTSRQQGLFVGASPALRVKLARHFPQAEFVAAKEDLGLWARGTVVYLGAGCAWKSELGVLHGALIASCFVGLGGRGARTCFPAGVGQFFNPAPGSLDMSVACERVQP